MSASLAYQKVSRMQLAADAALTALVPAANIFDANARPERFPCIRLGEDQELPADETVGRHTRLYSTFHIWAKEPGLQQAKAIAGAVRRCLRGKRWQLDGYACIATRFESARFLRDPDGVHSHGIVTFESTLSELS